MFRHDSRVPDAYLLLQGYNFTYIPEYGGFGDMNEMSTDQRGFKTFIQAEAAGFLQPAQVLLNAVVKTISYSPRGVNVTLTSGEHFEADYVLTTFSLGVLQNDDVIFDPPLPDWKQEAIQGMTMVFSTSFCWMCKMLISVLVAKATYTKVFLQFPDIFWFSTEVPYTDDISGHAADILP